MVLKWIKKYLKIIANIDKSFELFAKSADLNCSAAVNALGGLFTNGFGCDKSKEIEENEFEEFYFDTLISILVKLGKFKRSYKNDTIKR